MTRPADEGRRTVEPDERFKSNAGRIIGRFGETVRRKPGPWTASVFGLLRHLEDVKFAYSPRVLGFDDDGNEVLTFIPGESGADTWAKIVPEEGLRGFARLLRSYHDAVADFEPSSTEWATETRAPAANEIICHGDFGPWNTVWRGDEPVGIIDWELAGPRPALYDVAYALEYAVPFRDDAECVQWLRYPSPPDRARRMAVFAHAYGLSSVVGLFDEVVRVQRDAIAVIRELAERGEQPQGEWVAAGHLDELEARARWSEDNRRQFEV